METCCAGHQSGHPSWTQVNQFCLASTTSLADQPCVPVVGDCHRFGLGHLRQCCTTNTWMETTDDLAMADLSAQPLWTGQLCFCEWLSVVWPIWEMCDVLFRLLMYSFPFAYGPACCWHGGHQCIQSHQWCGTGDFNQCGSQNIWVSLFQE